MCFSPETIAAVRTVLDRRYRATTSAEGDAAICDYRALVNASKGPSSAALRAFASSKVDRDLYNFTCAVFTASGFKVEPTRSPDLRVTLRDQGLGCSFTIESVNGGVLAYGERVDRAVCEAAVRNELRIQAFKLGRAPVVETIS